MVGCVEERCLCGIIATAHCRRSAALLSWKVASLDKQHAMVLGRWGVVL
jgi:hypothetical protein